jgi:hypothetical protein
MFILIGVAHPVSRRFGPAVIPKAGSIGLRNPEKASKFADAFFRVALIG